MNAFVLIIVSVYSAFVHVGWPAMNGDNNDDDDDELILVLASQWSSL